jgi:nitrogen regulatory protein PII
MENKIIKLEIIISKVYMESVADFLEKNNVSGFTALEISRGKGKLLGEHISDGISNDTLWMLVFTVITFAEYSAFKDNLAKQLKTIRGTCIVTEVLEATNIKL